MNTMFIEMHGWHTSALSAFVLPLVWRLEVDEVVRSLHHTNFEKKKSVESMQLGVKKKSDMKPLYVDKFDRKNDSNPPI